ncbi:FUSC family protein [Streptomyces sp. NPDC056190]|uniref:FUSC family protein n=1 Tax=Streptomyces sp. NPDC056190 TaxID=3345741 RepID=UPI0035D7CC28
MVVGVGAALVWQMPRHPAARAAVFVALMTASVWARWFGPRAARVSLMVPLALILADDPERRGGRGQLAGLRPGGAGRADPLLLCARRAYGGAPLLGVRQSLPATAPRLPPRGNGLAVSTRKAVQTGIVLTAAFVAGWLLVLGRGGCGNTVPRGAERGAGALAGTVLPTGLAWAVAPRGALCLVLILVVLVLAAVLRDVSYPLHVIAPTALMSLLHSRFGQFAAHTLLVRLQAVAVGAALAVALRVDGVPGHVAGGDGHRGRGDRAPGDADR